MTVLHAQRTEVEIRYSTLELFPLSFELIEQLDYVKSLNLSSEENEIFKKIHAPSYGENTRLRDNFTLYKLKTPIVRKEILSGP